MNAKQLIELCDSLQAKLRDSGEKWDDQRQSAMLGYEKLALSATTYFGMKRSELPPEIFTEASAHANINSIREFAKTKLPQEPDNIQSRNGRRTRCLNEFS